MPTYQYKCTKCRREFTLKMGLDEHQKKKIRCPKCNHAEVKQIIVSVFVTTSRKS